jgi:hypothetical protein
MINVPPTIYDAGGLSAEQEIAQDVVRSIKPQLRQMLAALRAMSEAWNVPANNIDGKIASAHLNGVPLAGYSADTWDEWGQGFQAIMQAINTPVEIQRRNGSTVLRTPAEILATRDERINE